VAPCVCLLSVTQPITVKVPSSRETVIQNLSVNGATLASPNEERQEDRYKTSVDILGMLVDKNVQRLHSAPDWETLVQQEHGPSHLRADLQDLPHPPRDFLASLEAHGVTVAFDDEPWILQKMDDAVKKGCHPTCWIKKNDVAKMRQAGTAPATGTTIYCTTSLWCTVIYKPCSAMDTTNTLLQANVRLVLRSDLCRIYCAIVLFGIRSSCVRHCRGSFCVYLSVSNGSNASLRRLRVDQRGFPSLRVLRMHFGAC